MEWNSNDSVKPTPSSPVSNPQLILRSQTINTKIIHDWTPLSFLNHNNDHSILLKISCKVFLIEKIPNKMV